MLTLRPNEQLLSVLRRHWFVLAETAFVFILAALAPFLAVVFLPRIAPAAAAFIGHPLAPLAIALYEMTLATAALIVWLEYYLDAWIITTDRVITVEQHGLFHREVSDVSIERVQNVTVETPGFLATTLGFGTIIIETAGEGSFRLAMAPNCHHAKDLILEHSRRARSGFDETTFAPHAS